MVAKEIVHFSLQDTSEQVRMAALKFLLKLPPYQLMKHAEELTKVALGDKSYEVRAQTLRLVEMLLSDWHAVSMLSPIRPPKHVTRRRLHWRGPFALRTLPPDQALAVMATSRQSETPPKI